MSWPFAPSAAIPRSSNGRSTGMERIRSIVPVILSNETSLAAGFAVLSRGSVGAGPPFSLILLFFDANSGLPAASSRTSAACVSSSSSSAAVASSRITAAATSPVRISVRIASRRIASKILSSCQVCNILATSRFSCGDCTLLNACTMTAWTLSASSALYRPVLSIRRMSSTRCSAWINSQGKHCFTAKSKRTCDNCLACFA
mmetsp:Transcript_40725/g.82106  ORF Transcript_40725/g.82106 Transcript_40725/m.82106 type:complete len:202 (-) Transcript_40725:309-914(-)